MAGTASKRSPSPPGCKMTIVLVMPAVRKKNRLLACHGSIGRPQDQTVY